MQQERIKKAICWLLVIACMGVIFWLSSRTAEESDAQSSAIVELITRLFGDGAVTSFIVRKSAHFLEFTGLCLLFNIALHQTKKKPLPILSIALTSAYAITDEVHQLFIEGRSCQFSDWLIDSCGAILGAAAFMLILHFIRKHYEKKVKFVDTVNN